MKQNRSEDRPLQKRGNNVHGWPFGDEGVLADRPVLGRKPAREGSKDADELSLYHRGKVRDTCRFAVGRSVSTGEGSNQPPHPIHLKGSPLEV